MITAEELYTKAPPLVNREFVFVKIFKGFPQKLWKTPFPLQGDIFNRRTLRHLINPAEEPPAKARNAVLHIHLLKTPLLKSEQKEYTKIYQIAIVIVEKICYYNTCI